MTIETINPATGAVIKNYKTLDEGALNQAVEQGYLAFTKWRQVPFTERRLLMSNLVNLLQAQKATLSAIITQEIGKPIKQSQAEIEKCAWVCQYYAEQAEDFLKPRFVQTEMSKTFVSYHPMGVILAVMPWNFPFWQVFRFAIPTIMAGNAAILKHAPNSIEAGETIASLIQEAGFPAHLFQHVILDNEMTAKAIAHPKIAALSFTGSEKTGRLVASLAAANLKKSVLELGGNDPYLILADADIELAASNILASRLNNCGQVCIAAKRIIVDESIHDELVAKILSLMTDYSMGDPTNPATMLGPMARKDLRDTLHKQVTESIKKGAVLVQGGKIPPGEGYYYPPTVLTHVKPGMPAFDEELFGPVIAIISSKDQEEAISLANNSRYGLAAAVFTRDLERGEAIAKQDINTGVCFVNTFVASDPRVPFGGVKFSGYGRELSKEGILEFVNVKTVSVK
ncbi:aldehyde dehydrogenase [Legionella beliardensis]|uniref:Aldehyde dehydrogenase n=1 Tax=Legionella beliardensis TaxID=91822 RepID=A0A378I1V8_9GAMM|nr:NAD-dependent succinate-semialdehyde dehydrogenase [Legionella beliardensis]STX29159.1 aldehyde dehydrogenase [Legionella beliardensis]